MDELTIDGKVYVSSKRAAAITGYAKDYVGQLCREGRVEAKLVGRSWYVYEPSLKKHRFSDTEEPEQPKAETVWGGVEPKKTPLTDTWEVPAYMPEEVTTLPPIKEVTVKAEESPEDRIEPLSDMQSAWQEWFSVRRQTEESVEAVPVAEPVHHTEVLVTEEKEPAQAYTEPENVPLRTIVSDIEPVARREEPVRQIYAPAEAVHVSSVRPGKATGRRRGSRGGRRVLQAALIAIMAVSASIAIVSTGFIDALHLGGTSELSIIRFIEGKTIIEK